MSLPANTFEMRVSPSPATEEGAGLTGRIQGDRSFTAELEVILPEDADADDAFDYVQALMTAIKDKLEADFTGETWSTSGRFIGTVAGDPWTA